MVLFFCLTTLQNWQNCPAALTNHSGFLSIQLGFFRTSRGGANIRLPEAKILNSELKWDSFKLYHEDESIFKQIKMEENNEVLKNLVQNAETDAVANGLLDNARSNAETILRGFFGNVYNLEEYEIRFINK